MKIQKITLVVLAIFSLLACQKSQTEGGKNAEPTTNKFQAGIEYKYFPSDDNASCTSKSDQVCLTYEEYKEICSISKGVTNFSIKTRAVNASHKEKVLLEGGSISNIAVTWSKSMSGKEQCYAIVFASGIIDGSSAKESIQGVAQIFVKNNEGNILVSYWNF